MSIPTFNWVEIMSEVFPQLLDYLTYSCALFLSHRCHG